MTRIPHDSHVHHSEADYEQCVKHQKATTRMAVAILIFIALALACASCFYAQLVYGDWTCGLPGVECRKVVTP